MNREIFELCSYYHQLRFTQHQEFDKNHEMTKELIWKDMIHTINNGLWQIASDFIKDIRFQKFSQVIILAYIFSYRQGIFYLYFTPAMNSKKLYPYLINQMKIYSGSKLGKIP